MIIRCQFSTWYGLKKAFKPGLAPGQMQVYMLGPLLWIPAGGQLIWASEKAREHGLRCILSRPNRDCCRAARAQMALRVPPQLAS